MTPQAIDDDFFFCGRWSAYRNFLHYDIRGCGFAQQVPAVEQHQRSRAARELAKLLDDGMLSACDHVMTIMVKPPRRRRGQKTYATLRSLKQ